MSTKSKSKRRHERRQRLKQGQPKPEFQNLYVDLRAGPKELNEKPAVAEKIINEVSQVPAGTEVHVEAMSARVSGVDGEVIVLSKDYSLTIEYTVHVEPTWVNPNVTPPLYNDKGKSKAFNYDISHGTDINANFGAPDGAENKYTFNLRKQKFKSKHDLGEPYAGKMFFAPQPTRFIPDYFGRTQFGHTIPKDVGPASNGAQFFPCANRYALRSDLLPNARSTRFFEFPSINPFLQSGRNAADEAIRVLPFMLKNDVINEDQEFHNPHKDGDLNDVRIGNWGRKDAKWILGTHDKDDESDTLRILRRKCKITFPKGTYTPSDLQNHFQLEITKQKRFVKISDDDADNTTFRDEPFTILQSVLPDEFRLYCIGSSYNKKDMRFHKLRQLIFNADVPDTDDPPPEHGAYESVYEKDLVFGGHKNEVDKFTGFSGRKALLGYRSMDEKLSHGYNCGSFLTTACPTDMIFKGSDPYGHHPLHNYPKIMDIPFYYDLHEPNKKFGSPSFGVFFDSDQSKFVFRNDRKPIYYDDVNPKQYSNSFFTSALTYGPNVESHNIWRNEDLPNTTYKHYDAHRAGYDTMKRRSLIGQIATHSQPETLAAMYTTYKSSPNLRNKDAGDPTYPTDMNVNTVTGKTKECVIGNGNTLPGFHRTLDSFGGVTILNWSDGSDTEIEFLNKLGFVSEKYTLYTKYESHGTESMTLDLKHSYQADVIKITSDTLLEKMGVESRSGVDTSTSGSFLDALEMKTTVHDTDQVVYRPLNESEGFSHITCTRINIKHTRHVQTPKFFLTDELPYQPSAGLLFDKFYNTQSCKNPVQAESQGQAFQLFFSKKKLVEDEDFLLWDLRHNKLNQQPLLYDILLSYYFTLDGRYWTRTIPDMANMSNGPLISFMSNKNTQYKPQSKGLIDYPCPSIGDGPCPFIADSKPVKLITADTYTDKIDFPYYYAICNLPLSPINNLIINGKLTSILGVLKKTFSNGDYYIDQGTTLAKLPSETSLNNISITMFNPDGTLATNISSLNFLLKFVIPKV